MKEKQMEKNNITVREMTYDDIDEVLRIENNSFSDAWSREAFEYSINAEYDYTIVAEYDGEIAGYAMLRSSIDTADITNIAVDEKKRRKGIAYELMKSLLAYGYSTGVTTYTLEVRSHNYAAIRLYEKFRFEIVGIRKNYYSNPVENGLLMIRGTI